MLQLKRLLHSRGGQSLIEFAIATPILLFLFLGAFDVGVMISDKVVAGYSVRQGARLASELGGTQTNPGMTTLQLDQDVVKNVLTVAKAMNYSVITEVDIYRPTNPNGNLTLGTDQLNRYDINGNLMANSAGNPPFPITNRSQTPPGETSIGIKLFWTYHPPSGGLSFTANLTEFAVMKASPVLI